MVKEISQSTPITVGLLVSVMVFVVGAIWWASSIQTKLDVIIQELHSLTSSDKDHERRIQDLEYRTKTLEQNRKP